MVHRKNFFDDNPFAKNISKGVRVDGHHIDSQKDGGSHESYNIALLLTGFHRAYEARKKSKNPLNIEREAMAGVTDTMIFQQKLFKKF